MVNGYKQIRSVNSRKLLSLKNDTRVPWTAALQEHLCVHCSATEVLQPECTGTPELKESMQASLTLPAPPFPLQALDSNM